MRAQVPVPTGEKNKSAVQGASDLLSRRYLLLLLLFPSVSYREGEMLSC